MDEIARDCLAARVRMIDRAVSSNAKGVREVAIAPAGRAKIESLIVEWRAAQAEASRLLGDEGARSIRTVADFLWGGPVP